MYCCIQPLLSTVVTNSVTSQPLKQPQQQPLKIALSLYIYISSLNILLPEKRTFFWMKNL